LALLDAHRAVPSAACEQGREQGDHGAPRVHASPQAFAAATFGAEFTGPLPEEVPDPELPPLLEELPLLVEVEGVLGAAAPPLESSVLAAGFESPPSEGFDLLEE